MLCFSSFSCDQFFQDDAKARFYTLFHSAAFSFHFSVPKYSSKHHRLHQNRCFLHFQGQIIVCWSCKDSFTSWRAPIRCFLAFSSLHIVVNPWKVQKIKSGQKNFFKILFFSETSKNPLFTGYFFTQWRHSGHFWVLTTLQWGTFMKI